MQRRARSHRSRWYGIAQSRERLQFAAPYPAMMAVLSFDAVPIGREDEHDNFRLRLQVFEGGGALEGRGLEVGARGIHSALNLLAESGDADLQLLQRGVARTGGAGCGR